MTVLQGVGVSRGIGFGPAFLYRQEPLPLPRRKPRDTVAELGRFEQALQQAMEEIRALPTAVPPSLRREAERLLQAQSLLLGDPSLVDRTRGAILEGTPAERAWQAAVEAYLAIFPTGDERLRARVTDLQDIGRRVLAALLGQAQPSPFEQAQGAVLVAELLTPTELLQLNRHAFEGIALAGGAPGTPVAVVARALELPAVVGLGEALWTQVRAGEMLVVDGGTGLVEVAPDAKTLARYRERQELLRTVRPAFDLTAPVRTADGWRVDVRVDLEHPAGLVAAMGRGAEGLGLVRTDFAFLGRSTLPTEEEQYQAYRGLLEQLPEGPVPFCTLSVGLEEHLPFPAEPQIGNPLLGLRGVRLSLAYLSAFREQLRAILRAGAGRPLTVVLPMVETLAELRAAREWLRRAQQDLANASLPHSEEVTVALLLQTPLAVLNLEALLEEVGQVYLDLDRLTEYLLACDRQNLRVVHLFRPFHPVVLRLVRQAVEAVHRRGLRLEVCGEGAGHSLAVPLLLGLEVDGFCLPAEWIPAAKAILRRLTVPEAQRLAGLALGLQSAPEVEMLMERQLD